MLQGIPLTNFSRKTGAGSASQSDVEMKTEGERTPEPAEEMLSDHSEMMMSSPIQKTQDEQVSDGNGAC
jgi:hypothetical protein